MSRKRVLSQSYAFRLSEKPEQALAKSWLDQYLNDLADGETRSERLTAFVMWAVQQAAPNEVHRFTLNSEIEALRDDLRAELKDWVLKIIQRTGGVSVAGDVDEQALANGIDDALIDNILEGFQVR